MFFQSLLLLKSTEACVARALFVFHPIGFSLALGVSICSRIFSFTPEIYMIFKLYLHSDDVTELPPPRRIINKQIWVKRNPSEVQVCL